MNEKTIEQPCYCACKKTSFTLMNKPLMRVFCHCTICQAFNDAPFSDVTIFLSKDVTFDRDQDVNFKKYKSPPAANRGTCGTCHKPLIEFLDLPLFSSLAIIPSQNIEPSPYLPDACAHVFYHSRIRDIHDSLPKYSGLIRSQMLLTKKLVSGMLNRWKK